MRVCDRHHEARAADEIRFASDDSRVDLCAACLAQVREFLSAPAKKLGRPKKDSAKAE